MTKGRAGPAGLAAAVYGASEGVHTLLIDKETRPDCGPALARAIEVQVAKRLPHRISSPQAQVVVKVTSFENKFRDELEANGQEILTAIRTEKEISAATEEKLKAFMESFIKTFV